MKYKLFTAATVTIMAATALTSPASAHGWHFHSLPASSWGDSFAVGEGGTPYLLGSDTESNQCHRSTTSPAELLGNTRIVTIVADVACSGATTYDITTASHYGELPQATRIDPASRRTYGMIGGNDIGFGTVLGCFLTTECTQTPVPDATAALLQQLPPKLDAAYEAITAAAPHAVHTVVLYPPLLPSTATDLTLCPELSAAEVDFGNSVENQLNAIIAERARAHGMRVLNPAKRFAEHNVCASPSWFYRPGTVPPAATYHPSLEGRVAIALMMAKLH